MQPHPPVAIVTGGARRVGRAIVQRLADAGYAIAFTYHQSGDDARALQADLQSQGRPVLAIQADLCDPESAARVIHDRVTHRFPRLDLLVNNASIYRTGDLEDLDLADARAMWAIHFEAPLLLARRFAPLLRGARGHIVNMVDLLAERPWPQYLAYCATKAALVNLTRSLARALAPDVTVNGIAPGVVEWAEDVSAADREKYLRRVPLGRAGTPRDVAELVVYLATAAPYVTGQIIRLDGGRSIT